MAPVTLLSPEIEDYIARHSAPEDPLLAELGRETHATLEYPQMMIGQVVGQVLRLLLAVGGARRVLEVGTFSGYSALSMVAALPPDGHIDTCDIDPLTNAVARRYFARSPRGGQITPHLGPASETLKRFADAGRRFDFAFIDADKGGYVDYYETILPLLEPGSLLVADNCLWSGRVLQPESESDRAIARYNAHVRADPRVDCTLLSIRDGLMVARLKP